jgi:hypothetical protein
MSTGPPGGACWLAQEEKRKKKRVESGDERGYFKSVYLV